MTSKNKNKWEEISYTQESSTERMGTYGGWLVRTTFEWELDSTPGKATAITFVPDPEHKWHAMEVADRI